MKSVGRFWRENPLAGDRLAALLVAGVAVAWIVLLDGASAIDRLLGGSRRDVYGVLASIAGSLLGFSIAALAILLTLPSSPRVELLRQSAHYRTLCHLFLSATRWLAMATVVSFSGMILDGEPSASQWVMCGTILASIVSLARIARLIWAMKYLVEIATK